VSHLYGAPERVAILGYDGDAMEPFLTRDGARLFFNNSNDPRVDTNIHVADRVNETTFRYRGEVKGVNTTALDGVPSIDRDRRFYFVSTRSYEFSLATIFRGTLDGDTVSGVAVVPGVSRHARPQINFDAEISADGERLYFVDARFGRGGPETADLVVAGRHGDGFEREAASDAIFAQVNTADLEYAPALSADERTLVFTRADAGLRGRVSLYVAARASVSSSFDPPARLAELEGLVEGATFVPDGRAIYFHRRDGSRYVLYVARRHEPGPR
jgi:hypothetical protein